MNANRSHTPPSELGSILSIWAHPDDETYLAAGVMAAARDGGQRVVCVSATAGELGTDDPSTWPAARLGAVRRWESAASMAVLGVVEHETWDYPDGGLDPADRTGVRRVCSLIDTIRPETILTFGPDGVTYHPDHIAVHHWVTRAWELCGRRQRLLYASASDEFLDRYRDQFEKWGMYMSDDRPIGVPVRELDVHVRLDGAELDRKIAALRSMATQTSAIIGELGLAAYADQVAEESFADAKANPWATASAALGRAVGAAS